MQQGISKGTVNTELIYVKNRQPLWWSFHFFILKSQFSYNLCSEGDFPSSLLQMTCANKSWEMKASFDTGKNRPSTAWHFYLALSQPLTISSWETSRTKDGFHLLNNAAALLPTNLSSLPLNPGQPLESTIACGKEFSRQFPSGKNHVHLPVLNLPCTSLACST